MGPFPHPCFNTMAQVRAGVKSESKGITSDRDEFKFLCKYMMGEGHNSARAQLKTLKFNLKVTIGFV